MDELDRAILNRLQSGLPLCERPFAQVAQALGTDEDELLERLRRMLADGTLTRFGPLFDAERLGGAFTLAAMAVPPEELERVAALVNALPEVAHNYQRDHRFNLWIVLAADAPEKIAAALQRIEALTGYPVLNLPKEAEYFIGLRLHV
ncbi:AsnC family transcriptional regulator [Pelomicrobium sp. G1]|uniref:AsnC family transcriptional regulator n=1 Tax=unclassified Pelomicrobium TaxID=2815318 RepID=UPI0021DD5FF2|nr:MAG: protein NirG [Burkholderiales bacterium]